MSFEVFGLNRCLKQNQKYLVSIQVQSVRECKPMPPLFKSIICSGLIIVGTKESLWAQDLNYSPDTTKACEYATLTYEFVTKDYVPSVSHCIGIAAHECMIKNEILGATAGVTACYKIEFEYWDARLNAAYSNLMKQSKEADEELQGSSFDVRKQALALRDMQRNWIAFRDAKCDFEISKWGGGTGGFSAHAECQMQETAMQALHLENQLDRSY